MNNPVKRVAAIHDLSGFGRASLTAIIPILSNLGVQVCPVPTAILSTHTGGFENYSFVDLTDYLDDYIMHWYSMGLDFDCIYSGFLGSVKQIKIISKFIDLFKKDNNLVVVDPVLGDDGKLYATMNSEIVAGMKQLIERADIITPNYTEAALLLDKEIPDTITNDEIKQWLISLGNMGPNYTIITSVPDMESDNYTNVIAYDKENHVFWKVRCKYIPAYYPGTGDAFASVLIGSLLNGDSLPIALDRGVQFIHQSIKASYGFSYQEREGVLLERVLDNLKMPVIMSSYELF